MLKQDDKLPPRQKMNKIKKGRNTMDKYISDFETGNCIFVDTTNSANPEEDLLNAIIEKNKLSADEIERLKLEIKDYLLKREKLLNDKGQ